MDGAQLSREFEKVRAEFFNLHFTRAAGSLEDRGRTKTVHHDIACIYTITREWELGYHTTPSTEE